MPRYTHLPPGIGVGLCDKGGLDVNHGSLPGPTGKDDKPSHLLA